MPFRFGILSSIKHSLNKKNHWPLGYWQQNVLLAWDYIVVTNKLDMLGEPTFSNREIRVANPRDCLGREISSVIWQVVQLNKKLYERGFLDENEFIWILLNGRWFPAFGATKEDAERITILHLEASRRDYEETSEYKDRQEKEKHHRNACENTYNGTLTWLRNQEALSYTEILQTLKNLLECQMWLPVEKLAHEEAQSIFKSFGYIANEFVGDRPPVTLNEKVRYFVGQYISCCERRIACPEILLDWVNEVLKETASKVYHSVA